MSLLTPDASVKTPNLALTPFKVDTDGWFAANPDDIMANLTRAQWNDYVSRFSPIENMAMDMTTYNSPDIVATEVNRGIAAADTGVNVGLQNRRISREQYGIAGNNDRVQAIENRNNSITRTTAVIDAANRVRQNLMDRDRMIAVGAQAMGGATGG